MRQQLTVLEASRKIREVLAQLPSDEARREALVSMQVCLDCGTPTTERCWCTRDD